MISIFYNHNQSMEFDDMKSFSPSPQKGKLFIEYLNEINFPHVLMDFKPATVEEICLAHSASYVREVLTLKELNGHGVISKNFAKTLPWVCGSMIAAALSAFKDKSVTLSPTSGAHHANFSFGGSYCTFNFLMIAAIKAHKLGAKKISIIDVDAHFGDGTVDIMNERKVGYIKHYSYGSDRLKRQTVDWLKKWPDVLHVHKDADLIIYNAGVDPHIDDPLGGLMTTEELKARDDIFAGFVKKNKIPTAISLAGGYNAKNTDSMSRILDLHVDMLRSFL